MLSRHRIMERLDMISANVARMQRFAGMSYGNFIADPDNAAIVESYLRRSGVRWKPSSTWDGTFWPTQEVPTLRASTSP